MALLKNTETQLSYFVATLGQAQLLNKLNPHGIRTINQLLYERAISSPDLPAVGMAIPSSEPEAKWEFTVLTFKSLLHESLRFAHTITTQGMIPSEFLAEEIVDSQGKREPPTVAVLSDGSLDFLMTTLALFRIGCQVLILAPQCNSRAISHLLRIKSCKYFFHSKSLRQLAYSSAIPGCKSLPLPTTAINTNRCHTAPNPPPPPSPYPVPSYITSSTPAYIHHTSGTSSGLPKPVPYTHAAATSHLPYLPPSPPAATFTTTPLYHGGFADLMRSLMSSTMLWLYPTSTPLTAEDIGKALETADRALPAVKVGFFSAVPWVLGVCAEDKEVLRRLGEMEMVGVGGAPLGESVGERLVRNRVRLVSRYGSSECGFLLSSLRDFKTDKAWEYLRLPPTSSKTLHFSPQPSGEKLELIVQPGWPHMTKTNLPNGSYATGDLFVTHPTIKNAYKYVGRNDSLIVLNNGKKFDPTEIENRFVNSSSKSITEAVVFGNGRSFPGVLVFVKPGASAGELKKELLGGVLENVNSCSEAHAKILEGMVVYVEDGVHGGAVPKNAKQEVDRNRVYEMFGKYIQDAYNKCDQVDDEGGGLETRISVKGNKDVVERFVKTAVERIVEKSGKARGGLLGIETDLFTYGVDSVMASQIRNLLMKNLNLEDRILPLNVVFEQRNIRRLANYIVSDNEKKTSFKPSDGGQTRLMLQLVEKYGNFDKVDINKTADRINVGSKNHSSGGNHVVILTGATGALGAHILNELRRREVKKVVCFCRAESHEDAQRRVEESLQVRRLPELDCRAKTEILALSTSLGGEYFGLEQKLYQQLLKEVNVVIHAAWAVNFVAQLESFEQDHIAGVKNLLNFTSCSGSNFYFCSSTAAVLGPESSLHTAISENITADPLSAAPLGYARSKWVAEKVCENAALSASFRGKAGVLRIGQLSGDTKNGVWNEMEGWPLMFKSLDVVGCLPELNEHPSWLPVDLAASTIVDIATSPSSLTPTPTNPPVFHILNPNTTTPWSKILDYVQSHMHKKQFPRVPPSTWVNLLTKSKENAVDNPCRKLLDLWTKKYSRSCSQGREEVVFECENTLRVSKTLTRGGFEIGERYVCGLLRRWEESGFLKA